MINFVKRLFGLIFSTVRYKLLKQKNGVVINKITKERYTYATREREYFYYFTIGDVWHRLEVEVSKEAFDRHTIDDVYKE